MLELSDGSRSSTHESTKLSDGTPIHSGTALSILIVGFIKFLQSFCQGVCVKSTRELANFIVFVQIFSLNTGPGADECK